MPFFPYTFFFTERLTQINEAPAKFIRYHCLLQKKLATFQEKLFLQKQIVHFNEKVEVGNYGIISTVF